MKNRIIRNVLIFILLITIISCKDLFEDKHHRKIIVEVKRGILSREASGQIAEYFGLLKSQDQSQFYELVLCANIIPKERRLFLESIGIECKELGIAYITKLAEKFNYVFSDDPQLHKTDLTLRPETREEHLRIERVVDFLFVLELHKAAGGDPG